ncbi:hypothetical protein GH983_12120 [Agrobacterium sp. MA01]|uniref:DUF6220 domain-containing protein n=1 Tax=Agrobacterium sp. MA01 TaxID=2664893 RepID=UPI00129B21AE|nr:DUF6220 domain-containing protein [Agrobacterium sp. MA01]QGG91165.1 hypothetical protein GH983_12120 [Agrobacterium sp. MA01]
MSGAVVAAPIAVLVFRGLAVTVLAGVVVQFFLAGMTVFGAGMGWDAHAATGGALGVPLIGLFLMSLSQGLRAYRGIAGMLFALYLAQVTLAALGGALPLLGALHPVNGLVMALVALQLVRRLKPHNRGSF